MGLLRVREMSLEVVTTFQGAQTAGILQLLLHAGGKITCAEKLHQP